MNDTPPAIRARVRAAVRLQPPIERLRAVLELSESMRAISLTALRARFPDHSTVALVEILTGESLRAGVRDGPVVAQ